MAPHRLYGHVAAAENYSVGLWQKQAMAEIIAAHEAGKYADAVDGFRKAYAVYPSSKLQYNLGHENLAPRDFYHLVAAQFTLRF